MDLFGLRPLVLNFSKIRIPNSKTLKNPHTKNLPSSFKWTKPQFAKAPNVHSKPLRSPKFEKEIDSFTTHIKNREIERKEDQKKEKEKKDQSQIPLEIKTTVIEGRVTEFQASRCS